MGVSDVPLPSSGCIMSRQVRFFPAAPSSMGWNGASLREEIGAAVAGWGSWCVLKIMLERENKNKTKQNKTHGTHSEKGENLVSPLFLGGEERWGVDVGGLLGREFH